MSRSSRQVPYSEFRQAVRAYAPSELIPHLAASAARIQGPPYDRRVLHVAPPWAYSAAARESVLWGNESRSKRVNERGLRDMFWKFSQSVPLPSDGNISRVLTAIPHEQFLYQESAFEEMCRVGAYLDKSWAGVEPIPWADVLGVDLDQAMRAVILLHAGTKTGGGRFTLDWLDQHPELYEAYAPAGEIKATFRYLTRTIDGHKVVAHKAGVMDPHAGRYAFNPLRTAPFVDLGKHGIWAPQHALIPAAISVANLYYAGVSKWGTAFAEQLGKRMESYVGRNLRTADGADVHPEVDYGTKSPMLTVDWFLITESAVILVECKSARLTAGAMAGDSSLESLTERYLVKARDQIDKTAELIRNAHPAVAHIPKDRPLVGLTITAEPFYLANSGLPEYGRVAATPALVGSLRDIEYLVRLPADEIGKRLLDVATDPTKRYGRVLEMVGDVGNRPENPILEAAWDSYDYLDPSFGADIANSGGLASS